MSSAADFKTRTVKELAELARKKKIIGWHDMRKGELMAALAKQAAKAASAKRTSDSPKKDSLKAVQSKNGQAKNGQAKNGHSKNGHAKIAPAIMVEPSANAAAASATSPGSLVKNGHAKNGASGVAPVPVAARVVASANGHSKNGSHTKNGASAVLKSSGMPVKLATGSSKPSGNSSKLLKSSHLEESPVVLSEIDKHALLETKRLIEKGPKPRSPHAERRLQQIKARLAEAKDLAFRSVEEEKSIIKDRLVVMVRDPYWLHAYWELSRRSIHRAEVAMGQHWHAARPVLRIHEVSRNGTTSASRQTMRDIEIHGGVNNWYIDVQNPPKSYQVEIGYLAPGNRFYCLGRSNTVSTPTPGSADTFDRNWAEVAKECDRVYAMTTGSTEQEANGDLKDVFEEHMHRPMGDSLMAQFGPGASGPKQNFRFQIDTELIVHGVTQPDARVTLRGEPVRLRPDGSFAVRFSLPDRRHVLPVVANSGDGAEQRTIVLAIDRNTKVMEPVVRDPGD